MPRVGSGVLPGEVMAQHPAAQLDQAAIAQASSAASRVQRNGIPAHQLRDAHVLHVFGNKETLLGGGALNGNGQLLHNSYGGILQRQAGALASPAAGQAADAPVSRVCAHISREEDHVAWERGRSALPGCSRGRIYIRAGKSVGYGGLAWPAGPRGTQGCSTSG